MLLGGKIGVILIELSKAPDPINHKLLLPKFDAYDFFRRSLKLVKNCSCNRHQQNSVNSSFIDWTEVISGIPQVSILSPLLFNTFLNDIFLYLLCL